MDAKLFLETNRWLYLLPLGLENIVLLKLEKGALIIFLTAKR
jgi:hypothetical protein